MPTTSGFDFYSVEPEFSVTNEKAYNGIHHGVLHVNSIKGTVKRKRLLVLVLKYFFNTTSGLDNVLNFSSESTIKCIIFKRHYCFTIPGNIGYRIIF
jgi:hypothetical protein